MRRKIEVTSEGIYDKDEAAPPTGPDAETPEFSDHVTPSDDTAAAPENGVGARGTEQGTEDYVTALQAQLEEANRRVEEADKRVLYVQAEFQNFRRRKEEEAKDAVKFANAELIKGLLPVVDNFERALVAAEHFRDYDKLIGGVSSTLKQIQAFLERAGVTAIESVGKEFDPRFHEAIGTADDADAPANTVTDEVQKGYVMHERVLRPSLVKVVQ